MGGPALNERRSVLFVVSADREPDGTPRLPRFVVEQLAALRARGWDAEAAVIDDRTSPLGVWRNLQRLRRQVREQRPDVVHAQYGSVTGLLARLARQGRPALVTFCGDDLLGTPLPGVAWRIRERLAYGLSVLSVTKPGHPVAKSANLRDALPRPQRARATILPNATDLDSFVLIPRDEARAALGWPLEEATVLFNGSQGENQAVKNPALAFAAVDVLKQEVATAAIRTMSGVSREQVVQMMNAADCLLVTSTHEGSPDIVKEAMACNLPVVSVDCGDVAERLVGVEPGAIGPYDAKGLATLLAAVVAEPKRSNGRDVLVAQHLDLAGVTDSLVALYERALA